MLIGQKVVLWFLALILIPSLTIGTLLYNGFSNYVTDGVTKDLEYTAAIQESRVEDVVKRNVATLDAYTNRILLPYTLDRYNHLHDDTDLSLLNDSLKLAVGASKQQFETISILNLDGTVLSSSDQSYIGKSYSETDWFNRYKQKNSSVDILTLEDHTLHMYLVGPIMYSGKPIGVVTIKTSGQTLEKITSDYSRLGKTGETVLARKLPNGDAQFITNTRYDHSASLTKIVSHNQKNRPIMWAINGQSTTNSNGVNYRGTNVIAVTRPIKGTNWAIAVEMQKTEAFKTLNDFGSLAAGAMFTIVVLGVFTAMYASRILSDPLVILTIAVERMSRGDLSTRIDLEANKIKENNEFGLLAKAFNNMAENLEGLDRMKSEFVMLTSHQLRTPASSVKGFLALLRDGYAKPGSKEGKEILEAAYKENDQQLHLVNQILAVSQVESDQMKLNKTPIDLVKVAEKIVTQMRPIFLSRKQKVNFDLPKRTRLINADLDKVHMIIENIIANASKYSPDKTEIAVRVRYDRTKAMVEIKDQGHGLDPKDINKLFKKFSRLSNPNSDASQSSGLGLYLAKMLVELHGGTISATSPGVGRGSIFIVQLPIK